MESINELIAENELNINTVLLTGSMKAKEKREAYAKIESGEVSIIIGTHALIQDSVNYKNLALVITDEQHRFGVRQRESIGNKGSMPHINECNSDSKNSCNYYVRRFGHINY